MNDSHLAMDYGAVLNWPVLPLLPSRTPTQKGWQEMASADPVVIGEWIRRGHFNFGVRTGQVSRLCVIDLDGKHEPLGIVKRRFEEEFGVFPVTAVQETGCDGEHQLFYTEEEFSGTVGFRKSVDIRSRGNYIVVAPSLHDKTSRRYRWRRGQSPFEISIAPLPENIRQALVEYRKSRVRAPFKQNE